MMTLILFILIFGVVVLSHEFGHFLLAKKKMPEFMGKHHYTEY